MTMPENARNDAAASGLPTLSQVFGRHIIRAAVQENGEFWFMAADVARALDIRNPSQALTRLDEDEVALISNEGSEVEVNYVSESGLYSLILGSRKPQAKPFKRWVTHDLLPTLRRTGFYSLREEVVTANAIARAYGVKTVWVPDYMENHRIEPVGTAEDPDTGKLRLLYPKQAVIEKFMLGSGMRDGFQLRSYSGPWEPKTKTLEVNHV